MILGNEDGLLIWGVGAAPPMGMHPVVRLALVFTGVKWVYPWGRHFIRKAARRERLGDGFLCHAENIARSPGSQFR
jgi:hypothetical protein